jgi:hypothetical protein
MLKDPRKRALMKKLMEKTPTAAELENVEDAQVDV